MPAAGRIWGAIDSSGLVEVDKIKKSLFRYLFLLKESPRGGE